MNEMEIRQGYDLEQLSPEQLGGEIRLLTAQARKIVLVYAVEIGHRLKLAKEKVGHGEWMDWVARETTLSQSNVNRMMRLYEEYGSSQESLFGAELNSSTLANLSVSNALQLLAFPAEEREQAAVELDAEHLSSRELAEAIRERDAARKQLQDTSARLEDTQKSLAAAQDAERELTRKLVEAKKDVLAADEMAEKNERELKARIKELEERPIEVAVQRDEKAIEEAAALAKEKAEAESLEKLSALQKKLEKAEKERDKLKAAAEKAGSGAADKAAAAEQEAAAARAEIEQLRRQLAASDKDVTEFILHSKQVQESFNGMFTALDKIAARDMTTAQKLNAGMIALLKRFADRCTGLSDRKSDAVPLPGQSVMGG